MNNLFNQPLDSDSDDSSYIPDNNSEDENDNKKVKENLLQKREKETKVNSFFAMLKKKDQEKQDNIVKKKEEDYNNLNTNKTTNNIKLNSENIKYIINIKNNNTFSNTDSLNTTTTTNNNNNTNKTSEKLLNPSIIKITESADTENTNIENTTTTTNPDQQIEDKVLLTIKHLKEQIKQKILSKTTFAGEEFAYEKYTSERDLKKQALKDKNKTHKALDDIVDGIEKKKDINIYDKSKVDWQKYVDKNDIEKDLEFNRKDGLLQKKRFIDSTNAGLYNEKKQLRKRVDLRRS